MTIAHSSGWGFLGAIAIFIALVVLARALAPLIRSVGLVIGLIGAAAAVIAAALALAAAIFAGFAGWAGWNQATVPANPSAHVEPTPFAMAALCAVFAGALIALALLAHRYRKQD